MSWLAKGRLAVLKLKELVLDSVSDRYSSNLCDMQEGVSKGEYPQPVTNGGGVGRDIHKEGALLYTHLLEFPGINKKSPLPSLNKGSALVIVLILYFTGVIHLVVE